MPSTLPFQLNDPNASGNKIENLLEKLSLNEDVQEPPKIGKVRIMKSGKVVLRLEDPNDK